MAATDTQRPEATDGEAEARAVAARPRPPLMLMIAGPLMMVALAWALVSFVLKPMIHPSAANANAEMGEEADKGPREIVRFEGIVVNPSGTGGSRFLSTTVALEVYGTEARTAVEQAEPMIKDALITHLSSRTIEQLTDAEERELMREALLKRINPIIKPHKIRGVYFLDFVLQ